MTNINQLSRRLVHWFSHPFGHNSTPPTRHVRLHLIWCTTCPPTWDLCETPTWPLIILTCQLCQNCSALNHGVVIVVVSTLSMLSPLLDSRSWDWFLQQPTFSLHMSMYYQPPWLQAKRVPWTSVVIGKFFTYVVAFLHHAPPPLITAITIHPLAHFCHRLFYPDWDGVTQPTNTPRRGDHPFFLVFPWQI